MRKVWPVRRKNTMWVLRTHKEHQRTLFDFVRLVWMFFWEHDIASCCVCVWGSTACRSPHCVLFPDGPQPRRAHRRPGAPKGKSDKNSENPGMVFICRLTMFNTQNHSERNCSNNDESTQHLNPNATTHSSYRSQVNLVQSSSSEKMCF